VHTALAADARWLVSGDMDLLTVGSVSATRVVTPAEALTLMEAGG
jgi:predicted nucleic acid-binding protein